VNKIRKQKFPLFSTDITNYFFEKSVAKKKRQSIDQRHS